MRRPDPIRTLKLPTQQTLFYRNAHAAVQERRVNVRMLQKEGTLGSGVHGSTVAEPRLELRPAAGLRLVLPCFKHDRARVILLSPEEVTRSVLPFPTAMVRIGRHPLLDVNATFFTAPQHLHARVVARPVTVLVPWMAWVPQPINYRARAEKTYGRPTNQITKW